MNVLKSPVFIICCLLFILHQLLQKGLHISMPLVDSYLDNLLAMPIILTFLLVERRILFRRGKGYRLSGLDVVMATIYIIIISEIVFPFLSEQFVTDWRDVIFYALGSLVYWFTINRWSAKYNAA